MDFDSFIQFDLVIWLKETVNGHLPYVNHLLFDILFSLSVLLGSSLLVVS